jgi:oligoribonuclease (3'-5' exoribonuclease)
VYAQRMLVQQRRQLAPAAPADSGQRALPPQADIKESVHELRYYKQHVFKKKTP